VAVLPRVGDFGFADLRGLLMANAAPHLHTYDVDRTSQPDRQTRLDKAAFPQVV
jgi:hypothetical protein